MHLRSHHLSHARKYLDVPYRPSLHCDERVACLARRSKSNEKEKWKEARIVDRP